MSKTANHKTVETQCFASDKTIKTPLTFGLAIRRLFAILKWKFQPKKWIGTRIFIYGKMRPVTGETFDYIFVKGLSHEIRKDSRYFKKAETPFKIK